MDPGSTGYDDQRTSEKVTPHRSHVRPQLHGTTTENTVDTQRLNTAARILQSELTLADSQLSLADNADLLIQLYEILGPGGSNVDTLAMVAFNQQLGERIHKAREAV